MKNIVLSKVAFVILMSLLLIAGVTQQANTQHWPIPTTTGNFNRLNCSYSELHTGLRFHGGIDIDHDNSNPSVETILQGQVVQEVASGKNSYVVVAHESVPGSGDYDLQSLYMHIELKNNFDLTIPNNPNNNVATGTKVGISNQKGHLHFGMWRRINGQWYALNPLNNMQNWSITEQRNGQQQRIGYFGNAPLDQYDPQVNQVFLKGIEQPNQVDITSGYQIISPQNPLPTGGLTHFYNLQNQEVAARMHFRDRRDTDSNHPNQVSDNLTMYDSAQDRIAVFGNIVPTAHIRDQGVNSADSNVIDEGLTVQRLTYTIDEAMKYNITLDEFELDGDGPAMIGDDEQIFHKQYNVWTEQSDDVVSNGQVDAEGEYKYGNNDYIRLYNGRTAILNNCVDQNCPTDYLPPHKLVPLETPAGEIPVRSNGVWFTKAREGTPEVFQETPGADHLARCNLEAQYPDGEHTLTFYVEDAAGRIDRAENRAEDNATVIAIVDNFLPFVKKVEVFSGETLIYSREWTWHDNGTLTFADSPDAPNDKQADQAQPLRIVVTTSEPLALTTDDGGVITGSLRLTLAAQQNDGQEQSYLNGQSPAAVSEDRQT